ncbi:MAG: hypothetical protein AAF291_06985 [Pseudomonadota bacterium]
MMATSDIGFITMAFGDQRYIDQAVSLARSAKLYMPGNKFALVTDRSEPVPVFDQQIKMDDFSLAGTVLKTKIYEYSPFEETLFIDSDSLVTRDFSPELAEIRPWDFTPVVNDFRAPGGTDPWLKDVGEALRKVGGRSFPSFNGGVYFFRKSELAARVFAGGEEMLERQDELGILDFDKAGPGEETLLGLSMSRLGHEDFYPDHEGRFMRTPLNATSPIHFEVLDGECRFEKKHKWVEPAIVHFCGPWNKHPSYLIAVKELERGQKLSTIERASIIAQSKARKLKQKVENKLRR